MQKPTDQRPKDGSPPLYPIADPEAFTRNMLKLLDDGSRVMAQLIERQTSKPTSFASAEMTDATRTMTELTTAWMQSPAKLAEAQGQLMQGYVDLWSQTFRRMMGGADAAEPIAKPEPGDGRFKDPDWSAHPYFDYWKQAYLLTARWAEELLAKTDGLDERTRHKAEFYLRQMSSAFSPSNFAATNPEVVRETFASNAQNLVRGMSELIQDLEGPGGMPKVRQTDTDAFEVGRNLAVTPGKVVFQNEVIQLIQYQPTTAEVREVPLLIVPPWINKFYILDLTQPKSFIKHAVDQGFTVFIVSWVNPDARLSHKTFEDYMREGVLAATDAVKRETGQSRMNVLGYCVGGTLLGATLAYLAARGEEPYNSATFLATQVDFTEPGDLRLFIDEEQLAAIDKIMAEKGYLEGSQMAAVFNLLRPRDLIWPYLVNTYLLAKKPMPFDLLYWNQDSTRMPAANHRFYLRQFYLENRLAKGEMELAGEKLDLSRVRLPIYELATREDHIAPAQSVLNGARLFGGPVTFVLAGSGHIAGVVNPPDAKRVKYQHWTRQGLAPTIAEWLDGATETPGSWWPHWIKWLTAYSGGRVPARVPGATLGQIEDAPGSYVKVAG